MKIAQASTNFTKALVDLIEAVTGNVSTAKAQEESEDPKPETSFPKNFSKFRSDWESAAGAKAEGFAGSVFKAASCVEWSPEKIDLIVLGDPAFEASCCTPDGRAAVLGELREFAGFEGELVIRPSAASQKKDKPAPKKSEKPAPATPKEPTITAEEVALACKGLAEKLNDATKVKELLKKFGGEKAKQIDPSKYAAVLAAIKNYGETTTAEGISAEDF